MEELELHEQFRPLVGIFILTGRKNVSKCLDILHRRFKCGLTFSSLRIQYPIYQERRQIFFKISTYLATPPFNFTDVAFATAKLALFSGIASVIIGDSVYSAKIWRYIEDL